LIAAAAGFYTRSALYAFAGPGSLRLMTTAPFQARMVSTRSVEGTYRLMGDARMAKPSQNDAGRNGGSNIDCASGQEPSFAAQLRKTLNTIPAYTWYALPSGVLTFVNERYADYLGLDKDDPLRLGVEVDVPWDTHIQLVHPDDHEATLKVGEACNRTGTAGQAVFRIRNTEGKYRWFLSRLEPLRASDGTLLYWIGINLDIEELKRGEEQRRTAEEKIRQQEMELRHIVDLAPQLIAVFGPHLERLYANRMSLDYFGLTLGEWCDTQPGAIGHPDDAKRCRSNWDRALASASTFEIEVRLRRNDGVYRWFLMRCNPVRDDQGEVLRWYAACTDIEDRKQAEERLQRENAALREELNQASMFEEIVGSSEPLRKVLSQVSKVAPTDSTVLILGQTGTGKELIARAIHKRSRRAGRSFIGVNCGAIPTSLIASELFGHEKGAFTGATQRRLGRFEAANGGTIFLDEVGDLPPDIQIALLRVLQEREIERIGSDKPISVDVRVLAATHRDLDKLVSEGKFRQDLLYRLNVVPITMPSLRERASDIPILVEYFIARFGRKMGKKFHTIEKKTQKLLQEYVWPGNVRELQNVIERAVTLSDSDTFAVDEAWLKREPSEVPHASLALNGVLLAREKEVIEAALAQSHGRISGPAGAATKLGIPDSTLETKIQRLGIDKYRFKSVS
jgi:formate hydrogenlyase transcriptional activator